MAVSSSDGLVDGSAQEQFQSVGDGWWDESFLRGYERGQRLAELRSVAFVRGFVVGYRFHLSFRRKTGRGEVRR